MELSSQQRVAAPRDFVFAQASDFTAFERQALRRGIEVESRGGPEALGRGWSASVPVMGREREIAAEIVGYAAPEDYTVRGESSGVEILAGRLGDALIDCGNEKHALAAWAAGVTADLAGN